VRQLSLLSRDQGKALLHNLQEDLLQQSLAMPEAAVAVGVAMGELHLTGGLTGGLTVPGAAAGQSTPVSLTHSMKQ
jgi:hypothetical protein